jgi:hypothetical protein
MRRPSAAAAPAEVIREDEREAVASPTTKTGEFSIETSSSSSSSTVYSHPGQTVNASGSCGNKHHIIVVRHSKAAERKRIQYKCERQAVQMYDSMAGETSTQQPLQHAVLDPMAPCGGGGTFGLSAASTSTKFALSNITMEDGRRISSYSGGDQTGDSFEDQSAGLSVIIGGHHRHRQYSRSQNQQQHCPSSSSKSSFFSRLLRTSPTGTGSGSGGGGMLPGSSSRRCPLVRMHQRDYSIDERSDALFNEFMRHDPAYDTMHTLCVSRRRSAGHHRVHHAGGRSSRRRSTAASPEDRSPTERRHRLRRISHDVERSSTGAGQGIEAACTPIVGSSAVSIVNRTMPCIPLAGPKALLLSESPIAGSPTSSSSAALQWLDAAVASAYAMRSRSFSTGVGCSATGSRDWRRSCCEQSSSLPLSPARTSTERSSSDAIRVELLGRNDGDDCSSASDRSSSERITSGASLTVVDQFATSSLSVVVVASDGRGSSASPAIGNFSPDSVSEECPVGDSSPGSDDAVSSMTSSSQQLGSVGIGEVSVVSSTTVRSIPVIQLTTEDETL